MTLDAITLDQIRVFTAVVEAGSFSGAARALRRAQSAISYAIANLEAQLGLPLFEREGRRPTLTDAGRAVLADAQAVALRVDALRARARGLTQGLEPELSLAADVMFPMPALVEALDAFRHEFPTVPVRLYVEALGAVAQMVLAGTCRLGIVGPLPPPSPTLEAHGLAAITLVPVAAPGHPLALIEGPIPARALREHVQLVLTDRSSLTDGIEVAVLSPRSWRLADLGAKHALIRAGLGWGNLPEHLAREDLAAGRLVRLRPAEWPDGVMPVPMQVVHRSDAPAGPAARWLIARLQACAATARGPETATETEPAPNRPHEAGRRRNNQQSMRNQTNGRRRSSRKLNT